MKVLIVGDIIGSPGRRCVREKLDGLVDRHNLDLVIANGENAAGGFGITLEIYEELLGMGVHLITTGNHVWDKREIISEIDRLERLIRPHNYPKGNAGRGWQIVEAASGVKLAVINLQGRVHMPAIDCPFRAAEPLIDEIVQQTPCILVDFHAEATSEKNAMGLHLDGKVSAVVGTHTHVQTADERVLPAGTAYITDLGLTGARDSVIGMKKDEAIERFLTGRSVRFEVARTGLILQGAVIDIDEDTGEARSIERIQEPLAA